MKTTTEVHDPLKNARLFGASVGPRKYVVGAKDGVKRQVSILHYESRELQSSAHSVGLIRINGKLCKQVFANKRIQTADEKDKLL